jgi:hypothetical protein
MTILMSTEIRLLITRESGTNLLSIEVSKKEFCRQEIYKCTGMPEHSGSCTCHDLFHYKRIKIYSMLPQTSSTKVRSFGTRVHTLDLAVSNWH